VLNSRDFGVPQSRERVFIVGHLRGTPRPQVFPIIEAGGAVAKGPERPAFKRAIAIPVLTPERLFALSCAAAARG
jgi:site-specific DNA-cytosine methylase